MTLRARSGSSDGSPEDPSGSGTTPAAPATCDPLCEAVSPSAINGSGSMILAISSAPGAAMKLAAMR